MQHYNNYSGLEASVLGFCELCRSHELSIGLNHSEEALMAAQSGFINDSKSFKIALRSIFCSCEEEHSIFDRWALEIPGVVAVITGKDLEQYNLHWMPTLMSDTQMVLPTDTVMYQSQGCQGVILESLALAIESLQQMKQREGQAMHYDIKDRLVHCDQILNTIEKLSLETVIKIEGKVVERTKETINIKPKPT